MELHYKITKSKDPTKHIITACTQEQHFQVELAGIKYINRKLE